MAYTSGFCSFYNFEFASNSNLICGYRKENVIKIFNSVSLTQLYQKHIQGRELV